MIVVSVFSILLYPYLHILRNFTNIAYKFADNLIYKSKLKKSINLSIYTATYTIFKYKRV